MDALSDRINSLPVSATLAMAAKARELKNKGVDIIGLSLGEPDFNTPEYIKDAAIQAVKDNYNSYSPVDGYVDLKEAICTKFERDNQLNYKPSQIVVSTGAKQSIANLCMVLLNPGDEVLLPAPYWVRTSEGEPLYRGKPIIVDSVFDEEFKINTDKLDSLITPMTKILVWVSPSNPTGVVYTKEEAEKIYNWAFENDIWILSDELYEHLVYEGATSPSPAQYDTTLKNTIVINGVAKAYSMTGWRVGWIIANTDVIDMAKKIQSHATSNVSNLSQIAAYSALKNGLDETNLMKKSFNRRRLFAIEEFLKIEKIKMIKSSGAFYLFPDISYYCSNGVINGVNNSVDFCNWLLDEHYIAFVPGEVFGKNGFLRCSYALSDTDLKEGLSRFSNAIKEIQ